MTDTADEYESAAEWCAVRGLKGVDGDPLPDLLSVGALADIDADRDAFRRRVADYAYERAMLAVEARSLRCQYRDECRNAVTHIDDKGFIYCEQHGTRRNAVRPCREMSAGEVETLRRGEPISWKPRPRCVSCGENIGHGYSWRGLCVVCAKPHLDPDS